MDNNKSEITNAAELRYLTRDDCTFSRNGDFLSAALSGGEKYDRVIIRRLFPFEENDTYMSVTDVDGNEIGIINSLSSFSDETADLINNELTERYYICKLQSVNKIKESFGFTLWDCNDTNGKNVSFSVEGTSSITVKQSDGHIMIFDVDGNRYELPSVENLDKKSRKKIDLYL